MPLLADGGPEPPTWGELCCGRLLGGGPAQPREAAAAPRCPPIASGWRCRWPHESAGTERGHRRYWASSSGTLRTRSTPLVRAPPWYPGCCGRHPPRRVPFLFCPASNGGLGLSTPSSSRARCALRPGDAGAAPCLIPPSKEVHRHLGWLGALRGCGLRQRRRSARTGPAPGPASEKPSAAFLN